MIAAAATGRWLLASSAAAHAFEPADPSAGLGPGLAVTEEVVSSGLRYSGVVKELQKAELSFRVSGTVSLISTRSRHLAAGCATSTRGTRCRRGR